MHALENIDDVRLATLAMRVALLIKASEKDAEKEAFIEQQEKARTEAQKIYERTVSRLVAIAEADAIAKRKESEKRRKERLLAFLALAALLLADAGRRAYKLLGAELAGQAEKAPTVLGAGPQEPTALKLPKTPTERQAEAFSDSRRELLKNFPESIVERLDKVSKEADEKSWSDVTFRERIAEVGAEIEAGEIVSETEAQATYGAAQLRALLSAGFVSAYWVTVGDDRVRESHRECEAAGEVEIGKPFPNGLLYPGDPKGPASETANCRCILQPARRA